MWRARQQLASRFYGKLKRVRRVERQSPAPIQGTATLKIAMIAWYFASEPEMGCSAT
jgi:hypothetical protein